MADRDGRAQQVTVTGTFDNWEETVHLQFNDDHFESTVPLPDGRGDILYKFRVDGRWTVDWNKPHRGDGHGNENNVLTTAELIANEAPDMEEDDTASEISIGSTISDELDAGSTTSYTTVATTAPSLPEFLDTTGPPAISEPLRHVMSAKAQQTGVGVRELFDVSHGRVFVAHDGSTVIGNVLATDGSGAYRRRRIGYAEPAPIVDANGNYPNLALRSVNKYGWILGPQRIVLGWAFL